MQGLGAGGSGPDFGGPGPVLAALGGGLAAGGHEGADPGLCGGEGGQNAVLAQRVFFAANRSCWGRG